MVGDSNLHNLLQNQILLELPLKIHEPQMHNCFDMTRWVQKQCTTQFPSAHHTHKAALVVVSSMYDPSTLKAYFEGDFSK